MDYAEKLDTRAERLVRLAQDRHLTVACAESLTAGMTASAIAGVPGASLVLRGGAVTYCDEIKHRVLGVREETLASHTAVSEQTACEMATGAKRLFDADVAVSLTGYAGPDGGAPGNPAGTVYIATCDDVDTVVHRCHFAGTRNEVRLQAAAKALDMLIERIGVL